MRLVSKPLKGHRLVSSCPLGMRGDKACCRSSDTWLFGGGVGDKNTGSPVTCHLLAPEGEEALQRHEARLVARRRVVERALPEGREPARLKTQEIHKI